MKIATLCALTLLGMLPLPMHAQQPAPPYVPAYWEHFSAPEIRPGDVPRPCARSGGFEAEKSGMPQNIGRYRFLLRAWGDRHFKFEGGCTDFGYVTQRWQETLGTPRTGIFGPADVKAMDDAMLKAQPLIDQERERVEGPQRARAEAKLTEARSQLDHSGAPWVIDLLPAPPTDPTRQCCVRVGRLLVQLSQEESRIARSPEMQRLPFGAARLQKGRELAEQYLAPHRDLHPAWAALWAEQPLLADWAER